MTNYRFEIRDLAPQPMISVRIRCAAADLPQAYQTNLPKAFAFAGTHGGEVAGQPFAIQHGFDGSEFDVEMGCPLQKPINGDGEIHAGELPGGRAVHTSHFGAYDKLSEAYEALRAHLDASGLTPAGPPWDVYVSDPTTVAPEKVQTDIYWPIQ